MLHLPAAATAVAGLLLATAPRSAVADDLIDRFSRLDSIGGVSVATDGRHIALLCDRNGHRAACVYELDAIDKPPLVFDPRPDQRLYRIRWSGPEWLLLDVDITENLTNFTNNVRLATFARTLAINIRTRNAAQLLTNPEIAFTSNLTRIAAAPEATPDEVMMAAFYWRDDALKDTRLGPARGDARMGLFRVSLKTGLGKLVEDGGVGTYAYVLDPQGMLRARADFSEKARHDTVYRIESGGASKLLERPAANSEMNPIAGMAAGGKDLALGAYGPDGNYTPYLIDLATGAQRPVALDLEGIDVGGWISDGTSSAIVGVHFAGDGDTQSIRS